MTPTAPGERFLSYKICTLFTYNICYWEGANIMGGDKFSAGGIFQGDNFP